MKKITINIISHQLIILLLVIIFYRKLTILEYINVSFYIGGAYLFVGLFVLIVQSGSFDFFSSSFKKVFSRHNTEITNMRAPSEVITMKASFFFRSGLPIILFMLIALFVYS